MRKDWAITTEEHADGTKMLLTWDPGYFDGPEIHSREELNEFISELNDAANKLWPVSESMEGMA